jgi:hypothetical protein
MADQTLDADPFIPTGVDATPEQVAVMLADDVLPVEALTKMPERQYPSTSQIAKAAEVSEKPTRDVMDRLAPLTEQATGKITKAQLTARLDVANAEPVKPGKG